MFRHVFCEGNSIHFPRRQSDCVFGVAFYRFISSAVSKHSQPPLFNWGSSLNIAWWSSQAGFALLRVLRACAPDMYGRAHVDANGIEKVGHLFVIVLRLLANKHMPAVRG